MWKAIKNVASAVADLTVIADERQLLLPVNDNYNSRFIASHKSYYQDFSEAAETEGARRATGVFATSKSFYECDCISSFAFFLL